MTQQAQQASPKPQTPNLKPQTSNPKPQTPNPKPQTPHPKPQTPTHNVPPQARSDPQVMQQLRDKFLERCYAYKVRCGA